MTDSWDAYWGRDSNRGYWLEPDASVIELVEKLDRSSVRDVLDLGCGVGRHALLLASEGFNVTAVDSSGEALDVLRTQLAGNRLQATIVRGSYADDLFKPESFDLVVAYNVIYHGYRDDFREAIRKVCNWLRPGGRFFFTCPTQKDDRYGSGDKAAPDTYRPLNSVHPGDIHYFAGEADVKESLRDFKMISYDLNEHYWDNQGIRQFTSSRRILVEN